MITRVGAWTDRRTLQYPGPWVNLAIQLGLTDVSLSAHAATPSGELATEFKPLATPAKVAAAAQQFIDAGIRTHIMVWPSPSATHVVNLLDFLGEVRSLAAIDSGDLDAEGPWMEAPVDDAAIIDSAAALAAGWPAGLRRGVSAIVYTRHHRLLPLTKDADYAAMQAYDTAREEYDFSHDGHLQRTAHRLWTAKGVKAPLIMGLAAYRQRKGMEAKDMAAAAKASDDLGITERRYWSMTTMTDGPIHEFIRGECERARKNAKSA
jgi:hypothetical protein